MIYAIIYKTTCLVNGKIYIGQHYIQSQKTLDPWYIGSGTIISKAIRHYGIQNFKRDILCKINVNNPKLINKLEEIFISKYHSDDLTIGYNVLSTAVNKDCPSPMRVPEIAKKSGISHHERYIKNPELRKLQSDRIKELFKSSEIRNKISVALIGNTNRKGKKNSKEHNEAISRANKGKKRTEEQKKRMSEALKGRKPTSGTKGIKFSEEARLHMSISAKEAWKRRKVQNIRMQSTKHFN